MLFSKKIARKEQISDFRIHTSFLLNDEPELYGILNTNLWKVKDKRNGGIRRISPDILPQRMNYRATQRLTCIGGTSIMRLR
jgi:hypothetical protein